MAKSKGQTVVEGFESFIRRYVNFDTSVVKDQSLVIALWAIHTWIYMKFSATPYLSLTSLTKRCGKTTCMETLAMICQGAKILATQRPLAIVRLIDAKSGQCTVMLDEAERLASAAVGDTRSLLATGYRAGQTHLVSVGTKSVEMPVYCPKLFASIGDITDVLRDRSVVVTLARGVPEAIIGNERDDAEMRAKDLVADMRAVFATGGSTIAIDPPLFIDGRDREIWTVLFSLAGYLGLDAAMTRRLQTACVDLCGLKTLPPRKFFDSGAEDDAVDADFAQRALIDLWSVMGDLPAIHSVHAIDLMRQIPTAPWRTFRGGLTVEMLAALLRQAGVHSKVVRETAGKGASKAKALNGYARADVAASLPRLG